MSDTNFQTGTVVASTWLNDVNTITYAVLAAVAGTNTITATGASTVTTAYPRGVAFRFIPQNTNTGAVTINISGLGAKAITKYGTTPLVAGDIVVGSWAYIAYDGTQFQLVNPLSVVTGRLLNVQRFTASGTYTPTAGSTSVIVEAVGGGGAGGGAVATGVGQFSIGTGGGAGAYTKGRFASPGTQTVTVGSAGVGVSGLPGGAGTTTSFGVLLTAPGGGGGTAGPSAANLTSGGGLGGAAGTGGNLVTTVGNEGTVIAATAPVGYGTPGASSAFGAGGRISLSAGNSAQAGQYGAGGGGAFNGASVGTPQTGGNGVGGLVIVYEYS